ncbi:gliding motility-associated C-terminal domain-containing protein [Pontibacter locisalis]|uniref:Gliding motility-associated C-terminal domain-containing protein n=1 Tax=Pontibacter locisalis TaxID=1719035 RepID=A0ABW5IMD9_9BACT
MRLLLPKHLYFSLLFLCLFFVEPLEVLAQAPSCPATVTADGRTVLCQGETTTLRANAGAGLTYQWIKDGADIPGATGETIQVSIAGTYSVRVSGGSCTTNTSAGTEIVVDPRPNPPGFIVDPSTVECSGTPLTFSVNAPQPDLIYTWDFGDGNTDRGAEVSHTYDVRGTGVATYTVSVFATSTTSTCESEPVLRDVQVKRLPEISFTEKNNFLTCIEDSVADEDIEVTAEITNTTQEPYLTDIRSYTVDWGDGTAPVIYRLSDFPISNPNPYTAEGDYEIVITALAGNRCTETFTQTYVVSKDPKAGFEIDKQREEQDQQPPCVPVVVTPTDTASGFGLSYKWSVQPEQGWSFVTGNDSSAAPVFLFEQSGVYTIEQIVSNACSSDTTSQGIVVGWPQVQPPSGGTFCGPTSIDFSSSGPAGGGGGSGAGSILVDKNLGENVTVAVSITGPKSFSQTFNSESFNFTFNFDTPGRYQLTVVATNECGNSNQITGGQATPVEYVILKQPTAPTVQAPGTVCEGDAVTLTTTGGGPIFLWFDNNAPGAMPIADGPAFTTPALASGATFYVAAVDTANGIVCQSPLTAVPITVRDRIANNIIEGDETISVCKGGTVAELTGSTPTGGDTSVPYSYTWIQSTAGPDAGFTAASGTNTNKNYTPGAVSSTTWFRRVVSSASCTPDTSNVVQIIAVDPVPATANSIGPAQEICEGDTPQQLTGTAPSGGAGPPYTFLWEISRTGPATGFAAAPGQNNAANYTIQNLQPGDTWFRRKVTSGGCTTPSEPVKVTVYPRLANNTITPPNQDVCAGTATSSLTGSAPTGGKPGQYEYVWLSSTTGVDGSFTPVAGNSNTQSYTPGSITGTTYFKRVVSSVGCNPDTSEAAVIRIRPAITGNSITGNQEVCSGVVPNELTGTPPSGGNGGFTFRWESSISGPNSGFTPAPGPNTGPNYTPPALTRNTWFRRVAISQGCENASEAVAITILPLPASPTLTVKDARACVGGSATLEVVNGNGNTYEWFTSATGGDPVFVGPTFVTPELFQNTTYYVQAVNNNECTSATRTAANVTVVTPEANAGNDITIIQGRTAELRATGGTTYLWEPAEGLSNPNVANPIARPDVTTTYTVTVTTAEGCVDTDEVTVEVIPALSIPNAFTPNRDNVNEVWEIGNIENYPDVRVEVFNRWGNLIFTSNGYGTPWDGTYNGENLPVATYYYMIYLNKTEKPISGHVTIIR